MAWQQQSGRKCRLIVLATAGTNILIRETGAGAELPWVEVPRGERLAEHLTAAVKREWGCDAVVLFGSNCGEEGPSSRDSYEVLECRQERGNSPETLWKPITSLGENTFLQPADFRALRHCLEQLQSHERNRSHPFASRGWLCILEGWTADAIRKLGLQLTGFIRQLNASPDSNLIRFETTGPAVWFKAVGKRNLREFFVTIKLSELLPAFIPEIVAIKPECQGWLAREVAGTSLGETSDAALWEDAAARLARLQIESIPFIETLLPAGAHDIRSHALRSAVAPFFDLISRLMDEQPRSSPAVLGRQELSLIRDLIDDALVTLDQQEIPAALGHMDLNPWNMIVAPHGCVFLDWAEAYVGCPFFSFEYLLQHFRRQIGASPAFESRLTLAYKRHWAQLLSGERIDEALSLARLIAVFAYAVGNRAWGDEQKLKDPSAAGYLRSLARRMGREAAQLSEWRPPCPA